MSAPPSDERGRPVLRCGPPPRRCEKAVMSSVNVRNCIRFYQTAEELNASTLMNYCGEIIASHWVTPPPILAQCRRPLMMCVPA